MGCIWNRQTPEDLGDEKARSLPMFHAFTGCDAVSSFAGRGKKTAFDIWKSFNEVTPVFLTLSTHPTSISEACMSVLESYVVLLYDRTGIETSVDSARKHSQVHGCYTTNSSSTGATHKTDCIPRWACVGTDTCS